MRIDDDIIENAPLIYTIKLFNGKWKSTIIWFINLAPNKTIRYGALKRALDRSFKISHKALSIQLREMEEDGVLARQEYDEKPLRVEYSLTPMGESLANLIYLMRDWGAVWGDYEGTPVVRIKGEERPDGLIYYHQEMDMTRAHKNEQVPSNPAEHLPSQEYLAWKVPTEEYVCENSSWDSVSSAEERAENA